MTDGGWFDGVDPDALDRLYEHSSAVEGTTNICENIEITVTREAVQLSPR